MSGPFKLKYKNSAFPFKEPTGPTDIISAAGSAYTLPKDISVAADFLKGFATGLPTSTTSSDKGDKGDKGDKKESKLRQWWKKAIAEKRASHAAWRASRKGK